MTEKQYQQRELQGLEFLAHIGLLFRGGGRSEAIFYVFLSTDYLAYCLQKLRFFCLFFNSIATRIFALPHHGVPYIVNMDRNEGDRRY